MPLLPPPQRERNERMKQMGLAYTKQNMARSTGGSAPRPKPAALVAAKPAAEAAAARLLGKQYSSFHKAQAYAKHHVPKLAPQKQQSIRVSWRGGAPGLGRGYVEWGGGMRSWAVGHAAHSPPIPPGCRRLRSRCAPPPTWWRSWHSTTRMRRGWRQFAASWRPCCSRSVAPGGWAASEPRRRGGRND